MEFHVLRPTKPFDPRGVAYSSNDEVLSMLTAVADTTIEAEAAHAVHALYPDALAMLVKFRVGSGDMVWLGVVENALAPRDPSGRIDFVLFVAPSSKISADQKRIKGRQVFTQKLWNTPVVQPENATVMKAELRATDLDYPASVEVSIGRKGRQLALRTEINGVAMSLVFDDDELFMGEFDGKTLDMIGMADRAKEAAELAASLTMPSITSHPTASVAADGPPASSVADPAEL